MRNEGFFSTPFFAQDEIPNEQGILENEVTLLDETEPVRKNCIDDLDVNRNLI